MNVEKDGMDGWNGEFVSQPNSNRVLFFAEDWPYRFLLLLMGNIDDDLTASATNWNEWLLTGLWGDVVTAPPRPRAML